MKKFILLITVGSFLKSSFLLSIPNDYNISSEKTLQSCEYSSTKKKTKPLSFSLKENSQIRNNLSKTVSKKFILVKDCLLHVPSLIFLGISHIDLIINIMNDNLRATDVFLPIALFGHTYNLVKSIQKYKNNESVKNLIGKESRKKFFKNFILDILPIGLVLSISDHMYKDKCSHHVTHFLISTLQILCVTNSLITDSQTLFKKANLQSKR